MVHCIDFFRKWDKEENFCGLGKMAASQVTTYMRFTRELVLDYHLDEERVYEHLSVGSLHGAGLLALSRESPKRKEVIEEIVEAIKEGTYPSRRRIREWTGIEGWTPEFVRENCKRDTWNALFRARRKQHLRSEFFKIPLDKWGTQTSQMKAEILRGLCTVRQLENLEAVVSAGMASDLYGAFDLALKWGAEDLPTPSQSNNNKITILPEVPGDGIFVGARVTQVKGNSPAGGTGTVERIFLQGEEEKAVVKFVGNTKILPRDFFKPVEIRGGP